MQTLLPVLLIQGILHTAPALDVGECRDEAAWCEDWAKRGECEKNPAYMLPRCTVSCGACGPQGACKDMGEFCGDWGLKGECEKNPGYMHRFCGLTCGSCLLHRTPHMPAMPLIGMGTSTLKGNAVKDSVRHFIRLGGRHIDTAMAYGNQREIGQVLKEPEFNWLSRREVFLTTKVPPERFSDAKAAVESALAELQVKYIDLLLLQGPADRETNIKAWHALENLREAGKLRAIGVTDFQVKDFEQLAQDGAKMTPQNNQVNLHPADPKRELLQYCQKHGISVTAATGIKQRGKVPGKVREIASRLGKNEEMVLWRWAIDHGIAVIPACGSRQAIIDSLSVARLNSLSLQDLRDIGETEVMSGMEGAAQHKVEL